MRETRQSGSEGGGAAFIRLPLPLSPEIRTVPGCSAHIVFALVLSRGRLVRAASECSADLNKPYRELLKICKNDLQRKCKGRLSEIKRLRCPIPGVYEISVEVGTGV
jgi:hypothetical protein